MNNNINSLFDEISHLQCLGLHSGIKSNKNLDIGLIYLPTCSAAAGVFTQHSCPAHCVNISKNHLIQATPKAILVNSGCANAATHKPGLDDAMKMIDELANALDIKPSEILLAQTGVIGQRVHLNVCPVLKTIQDLAASTGVCQPETFAKSILTTDTKIKYAKKCFGNGAVIAGVSKGSGMISPNMATTLSFLITNVALDSSQLQKSLKKSVDRSFNVSSVDTDTSTNDMILILSTGEVVLDDPKVFEQQLSSVCLDLVKQLLLDAEGATQMIHAAIEGAKDDAQAQIMANAIVKSPLIKTMVAGKSFNWGRIVMAIGKEPGLNIDPHSLSIWINRDQIVDKGIINNHIKHISFDLPEKVCVIRVDLNMGYGFADAYGCDMQEDYVKINKEKS